jgi:DNA-binding phage protein
MKILKGQEGSLKTTQKALKLKKNANVKKYSPTKRLLDEEFIAQAIWECLKNNDPEGVMEIVEAHIEAINKVELSEVSEVPRSTLYHSLKSKNPTIKTLAKLINGFAA